MTGSDAKMFVRVTGVTKRHNPLLTDNESRSAPPLTCQRGDTWRPSIWVKTGFLPPPAEQRVMRGWRGWCWCWVKGMSRTSAEQPVLARWCWLVEVKGKQSVYIWQNLLLWHLSANHSPRRPVQPISGRAGQAVPTRTWHPQHSHSN